MEQKNNIREMGSAINARLFLLVLGVMLMVNAITVSLRNGLGYVNFAGKMESILQEGFVLEPDTQAREEILTEAASEGVSAMESVTVESGIPETEELSSDAAAVELQEKETAVGAQAPQGQEVSDEDVVRNLMEQGVSAQDLRLVGILSLLQAAAELICGAICALLANRVDKSKITLMAVAGLIVIEAIVLTIQFLMGAVTLLSLLYTFLIPLILLWAVLKLRKLAKADPNRIFAVMPRKNKASGDQASSQQATDQPKSSAAPSPSSGKSLRERAMMHVEEEETEEEEEEEEAAEEAETPEAEEEVETAEEAETPEAEEEVETAEETEVVKETENAGEPGDTVETGEAGEAGDTVESGDAGEPE